MSTRTQVWFNDVELTQWAVVSGWNTALLPREATEKAVPTFDGAIFAGARLTTRTITVRMALRAKDLMERQEEARAIARVLLTDEPAPLAVSIDGGRYYMAIATSTTDMTRMVGALAFDVTFACYDPVAYGDDIELVVPSGGSVKFNVGGTYPTMPIITAPAATGGSDGIWSLTLEDGMQLAANVGTSATALTADCADRTLTIGGAVTMLRPTSDWLVLEPGEHTLTMAGTGAATVTFSERWL